MTKEEMIKFIESDEDIFDLLKDVVGHEWNYFTLSCDASDDQRLCFMLTTTLPKKRIKKIDALLENYLWDKSKNTTS